MVAVAPSMSIEDACGDTIGRISRPGARRSAAITHPGFAAGDGGWAVARGRRSEWPMIRRAIRKRFFVSPHRSRAPPMSTHDVGGHLE